ncbi:MAG: alkane 1-monooxygenase [Tatlockia sp.]
MTLAKQLCFMLAYLLTLLPFIGFYWGGLGNFVTLAALFSIIPLIDWCFIDKSNPDETQEKKLLANPYFKWLTWLYVPLQCGMLFLAITLLKNTPLRWYEWLGFTISIGILTGGIGITLSHELMHKNSRLERLLSKALLCMVCYGHFFIEHVRGHHVHVATFEDPATARFGETVYQFIPRTISGSLKSAFLLESKRLKQKGLSVVSYRNQFWWIIIVPVLLATAIFQYAGWSALLFFILQSFTAILMLEVVNYIEHYGLERKKLANGEYERVTIQHSWNASHWLSNQLLFHLQRHSDHHAFGARPYQILRHVEESPQLPSGYLGMIILALMPPLWRRVMDKRARVYRHID